MDENPYKSPETVDGGQRRRFQLGSTVKVVAAALASMFAGSVIALVVTAPMGAIDGGGEYYMAYGAITGLIVFAIARRSGTSNT